MKNWTMLLISGVLLGAVGCSSIPAKKISGVELGMTPSEVKDVMGEPTMVRASKVYDDGQTGTVWEYSPAWFEFNPRGFWITFRNERVVQWGEPGDWAGKSGGSVPVEDYKPTAGSR